MKRALIYVALIVTALLLADLADAQTVQVSFVAQTTAVSKKISGGIPSLKGLTMVQSAACNSTPQTVSFHSGLIYQAALKNKIAALGPEETDFLFQRMENLHPMIVAAKGAQQMTGLIGILSATDTLALSSAWRGALPLGAQIFKGIADSMQGHPDFNALRRSLISDQIALPPGTCKFNLLFATAAPAEPVFAEIQAIAIPAPLPPAPAPAPEVKP
jgi:hypothetical protein